ncbi:LysR family transcriptional regulator [Paenibacillus daejeonensis]|uniref:LysR family transcriptional regulator n=1 Tax=Paenibacillus daejeonensis TaxID=135193 RepID=UPI0003656FEB|nr:LysR substrate-binding domain-containing protein [Paenibacillus daejeonensis]
MQFIKLDILVLLDRHKKITAVAGALGVKQPTVTFHMKSLEEQYGVPLFEMYGGKYELTRAGKALLHYARQIRSLGLEAGRVMAEQRTPERGTFHIGASYVAGTYLLPAWIHHFHETYPQVEVRLTIRTAPVIRQLLAERRIDLGFIAAQQAEADELYCEPLCEDRMVVAFAADHPLAGGVGAAGQGSLDVTRGELAEVGVQGDRAGMAMAGASVDRAGVGMAGARDGDRVGAAGKAVGARTSELERAAAEHTQGGAAGQAAASTGALVLNNEEGAGGLRNLTPQDIAAYPFLLHGQQSTTREMTDRWAATHEVELKLGMELDSLETIKRTLMLGKSVTFISQMAIREEIEAGRLAYAPLPGEQAPRQIFACYHPERWMSPQMRAFLDAVRQHKEPPTP